MPAPHRRESLKDFTKRFMSSPEAIKSFPDIKQRYAVMLSLWKHRKSKAKVVVSDGDDEYLFGLPEHTERGFQDDMEEALKNGNVAIT